MPKTDNIPEYIGKTYGRLTIVGDAHESNRSRQRLVLCTCSCGSKDIVKKPLTVLKTAKHPTCGCRYLPKRGEILINNSGLEYEVKEYTQERHRRILIKFLKTGYEKVAGIKEVKNGSVKDDYAPSIAGVGYIGKGAYESHNKDSVCYQTWNDMLRRCYKPKTKQTAKNYEGVTVCEEWCNYQNFAEWFYKHHVIGYRLDKDLKVFESKIYSPDTCTFIPEKLNSFLTGGLKRGIHFSNSKGKWIAQCQDGELCSTGNKRQTYLGSYNNEQEALKAYKDFKLNKLEILRKEFPNTAAVLFDNIEKYIKDLK